jgi:hypothetical protein
MTLYLPQGRRMSVPPWDELAQGARNNAASWAEVPPSGFLPSQLSSLIGWWRGDLGITTATGVSVWANQVAGDTNKDFVQATTGLQPTYNAADSSFNNQAALQFDVAGVNTYFMPARAAWAANIAQPLTLIIVARESGAVAGNRSLLDAPAGPRLTINVSGATSIPGLLGASLLNAPAGIQAAASIVLGEFNNTSSNIFLNSATVATNGTIASTNALGRMAVGGQLGPEFRGRVAEIIVCSTALSADEKRSVVDYLAARYAITVT